MKRRKGTISEELQTVGAARSTADYVEKLRIMSPMVCAAFKGAGFLLVSFPLPDDSERVRGSYSTNVDALDAVVILQHVLRAAEEKLTGEAEQQSAGHA